MADEPSNPSPTTGQEAGPHGTGSGEQEGGGKGGGNNQSPWPRSPEEQELDRLVFWSDLNEVYLLLDFVSGRPDRNFNALTMVNNNQTWHSWDVISEVAKIRYPPDPNPETRAHEAAVLLVAKDQLSRLADPARALTIAYTEMFVDAETDLFWLRGLTQRLRSWKSPTPNPKPNNSRIGLGMAAFPGLQDHARIFRRWRDWLMVFSVIWFGLTALTYWDASYGRSVLQRLDQFWKDRTDATRSNIDCVQS
jgi:hypothetical protein